MNNPIAFLDGYKTYIGAAGFLLLAVYYTIQNNMDKAGEYFLAFVGLAGLRHAVAKTNGDAPTPPPKSPPFGMIALVVLVCLPLASFAQSREYPASYAERTRSSFCIGLFGNHQQQPKTDPAVLALMQQSLNQQAASSQQIQAMLGQQSSKLDQILIYTQQCAQHAATTGAAGGATPATAQGGCPCQQAGLRPGAIQHPVTVVYPPNPVPNQILTPQAVPNQILVPQTVPNQVLTPQAQPNQILQPQTVPNIILMPQPQPNQILVPAGGVPNQPLTPATGAPSQPLAPGQPTIIPTLPPGAGPGQPTGPAPTVPPGQPGQPLRPGGGTGQPLNPGTGGQPLTPGAGGSPPPLPGTTPAMMPYAPANYGLAQYAWRPAAPRR